MAEETGTKRAKLSVKEEDLRNLAECPICYQIPRDGIMLLCLSGHKVCATCKTKIGNNANCPQGQCGFHDPPTRDRTVAGLVDRVPFTWFCKYSKVPGGATNTKFDPGCQFEGVKDQIGDHEADCPHRPLPVACPYNKCKDLVSRELVVEHCKAVHQSDVSEIQAMPLAFEETMLWKQGRELAGTHDWDPVIWSTPFGHFASHVLYQEGEIYIWLVLIGSSAQAEKLSAKITLTNSGHSTSHTMPVYPIDWSRERILNDEKCVRINIWMIKQMLDSTNLSQEDLNNGYSGEFTVGFSII